MSIDAVVPFLSVKISPLYNNFEQHRPWALNETYAGFFRLGTDGGSGDETAANFASLQYKDQPAFKNITGPLDFIRFTPEGTIERGVPAALASKPQHELCGITVQLRAEQLQNRMQHDPDSSRAPKSPQDAPVLEWKSEQGTAWETVMPSRGPILAGVRNRTNQPDHAYKIKTAKSWDKDRGFEAVFSLGDVIQGQQGEPALRFSWGDKFSLVLRGQGAQARPVIEQRVDGKWQQIRVLRECSPLSEAFWKGVHTFKVHRVGGRMSCEFDGKAFWLRDTMPDADKKIPIATSWPRAPLRLSLIGVDVLLQVHRVTGDSTGKDAQGNPSPLQISFERDVPAPTFPPNNSTLSFQSTGPKASGGNPNTLLRGDLLDRVTLSGQWEGTVASYQVTLTCNSIESPFLSAFTASFTPEAVDPEFEEIEFRPAVSILEVDSGDPEELPDSQASFNLSRSALDLLVPNWRTALLPYRPVTISASQDGTHWLTLFRGFLTPESASRTGWNDYELPMVARGPLLRTMKPAALVDERFAPLDLLIGEDRDSLYGAQAAKMLLERELGPSWVQNFNGSNPGSGSDNTLKYTSSVHFPLLSSKAVGYFTATGSAQSAGWLLPPPFGEDLKTWIDSLAKFDYAIWFYDPGEDAFFYGRIIEFFAERGLTVWEVSEGTPPDGADTSTHPLVSSLTKSGLLEFAFNEVRVWGSPPDEETGLTPSLLMGRASVGFGPDNPLSETQSWRRTDLLKPSVIKSGIVDHQYVQDLARLTASGFSGRLPIRLDAEFSTGLLGPRWGEILRLNDGFEGPHGPNLENDKEWRILRVKHHFDFSGTQTDRFSTTIGASSINAFGE